MEHWAEAVGASLAAGLLYLIKQKPWNYVKNPFIEKRMEINLGSLAQGLRILEDQKNSLTSGVDRAILFEGHDGGSEPKIGEPYYIDVIHPEITIPELGQIRLSQKEIMEAYSDIQVSSDYLEMLQLLIRKKDILFEVSQMPKSLLQAIYVKEGVTHSLVSYVAIVGESLFYMSQAKFDEDPFTAGQLTQAKLAANRMRSSFRKSYGI